MTLILEQPSTAYEIKTLYGRVAATAEKKTRALFTYGLARLFGMMIKHEEYLFEESFARAIGMQKPPIPLEEDFQGNEDAYRVGYRRVQQVCS